MTLFTLALLTGLAGTAQAQATSETAPPSSTGDDPKEAVVAEQQPEATSGNRTAVDVTLQNGIVLSGTVLTTDAVSWSVGQSLNFTPDDGKTMLIEADSIKAVRNASSAQPNPRAPQIRSDSDYRSPQGFLTENRGKSRYLYAPSAIGLKKSEGYYSQKLVFSAVAYGVTDNLTLLGGAFTFFPPALTIVGAKASTQVAPNVHLAAGGEVFLSTLDDDVSSPAQLAFGGVTLGDSDAQVTLSSGYVSLGVEGLGPDAFPLIAAGQLRISEQGALVSENWILLVTRQEQKDDFESSHAFIGSLAYRMLGPAWAKWSLDLGLVTFGDGINDAVVPLPWVDFAYHFGGKKSRS